MSVALHASVIHDPDIKDVRIFAVLLALADDAQKETHSCSSSINELSRASRCSRRTVIRIMIQAEQNGWIKVIRRTDDKECPLPNIYTILKYGPPSVTQSLPLVSNYTLPSVTEALPSVTEAPPLVSNRALPSVTETLPPSVSRSPSLPSPLPSSSPNPPSSSYTSSIPSSLPPIVPHSPKFALESESVEKPKKVRIPKPVASNPPSLSEFISYATSIGVSRQTASDQYEVWCANEWVDGNGTPIYNWKGKLVTFKKKNCFAVSVQKKRQTNDTRETRSF